MSETKHPARLMYRFGHFEATPETGELYRQGQKVRIQELPYRVLVALLEQQGQIVSRDVLAKQLWPAKTFVEFDQGLSTAVTKLRQAIGDIPENPRFIETVPRRGYRFIAPVTIEGLDAVVPNVPEVSAPASFTVPVVAGQQEPSTTALPIQRFPRSWMWTAAALLGLAALAVVVRAPFRGFFHAGTVLQANDHVLLADFDNATGNGAYDDTLNSALRVKLDESPFFSLVSPQVVQAAMRQMDQLGRAADGHVSPKDAQLICQAVHAKAIVHGSVSPAEGGLRLRLEANSCGAPASGIRCGACCRAIQSITRCGPAHRLHRRCQRTAPLYGERVMLTAAAEMESVPQGRLKIAQDASPGSEE